MRLFPGTRPADYQLFAALAEKQPIADRDELGRAAAWLARLADIPDEGIPAAMAYRWEQLCKRAGLAPDDPLRGGFAQALEARGGGEADPLSRLRA
jgi:hypothetical protein